MINIKITPADRINIERFFLMRDPLTQFHRVNSKQPFVIDVSKIGPYEVSNFSIFDNKRDLHSLLFNLVTRGLIKAESFSRWVFATHH